MMWCRRVLVFVETLALLSTALANVEKTIFLAPPAEPLLPQFDTVGNLNLPFLRHDNTSLRTYVQAAASNAPLPAAVATWLLLQDLNPGQRYEARICWAATQPTAFKLETFGLGTVLETPELTKSLVDYAASRIASKEVPPANPASGLDQASTLLLRVLATAEYYTEDKALMEEPGLVHVDIILDAFLMNMLPVSLLLTVGYILALIPVAWFIAVRASEWAQSLAVKVDKGREGKQS